MTNHIKKIFSFLSIFIIFGISGCETEKETVEKENTSHLKISQKPFKELILQQNFNQAFSKLNKNKQIIASSAQGKTVMEDQYGFIISEKPVNIVQNDSVISYTMLIHRENSEPNTYENLVVQVDKQNETKAIIIKYLPTTQTTDQQGNILTFQGTKKIIPIVFDNTTSNSRFMQVICVTTVTTNGPCPVDSSHTPGTYPCQWPPTTSTTECTYIYSDGSSNGGGGADSTSGGGMTSGGGTSSGGTETIPTPTNDCGACNVPVVTLPSVDEEAEQENIPKTDPCILIKKLSMDSKVKQKMINLETNAINWNYESCFTMYNDPNPNANICCPSTLMAVPPMPFVGNLSDPNVQWTGNSLMQGIMHSHFLGLLSVFSCTDLQDLFNIIKNPKITDDFFYGLVTQSGTKYMLTISDRSAFLAFGDKYLSTLSKLESFESEYYSNKYGIDINNSSSNNELSFVKMMSEMNTGIAIFAANTDFSNYKQLSIVNNQIISSNCN